MREIKFRAWDKKKNEMIVTGFSIIGEVTVFEMLKGYSISQYNDIEVMQYTGLKDINETEIYEGDIVEIVDHSLEEKNGSIGYLEYDNHSAGFFVRLLQGEDWDFEGPEGHEWYTGDEWKVIGNVYENPELLLWLL